MLAVRCVEDGQVASRRALVEGMEEVARTVRGLRLGSDEVQVIACWQDAAYVADQLPLLDELASCAEVVVACVDSPKLPDGVLHVPLHADDELVDELSVVVCSPHGGVALVGHELVGAIPASSAEGARAFRWQATHSRGAVVAQARRLLRDLGARIDTPAAVRLLEGVATMAEGAPLDELVDHDRLLHAIAATDEARRGSGTGADASGSLAALAGWLSDAGPRAPTLGLVVVRVPASSDAHDGLQARLQSLGRPSDLVVSVPPDAAMLVLPDCTGAALRRRRDRVVTALRATLSTEHVDAIHREVPAVDARRDLVGHLGALLTQLRTTAAVDSDA